MKVIKRDGRAVDYDKQKIAIAINKANNEVIPEKRASKDEIKDITNYIEALGKKRMLVEDIQDVIEQKLMELDKYELAKKYIVYRYTRALVRKSNTTDESILGLIRKNNKEQEESTSVLASTQRNYIAGEVSRDLTKRLLLPEKITKAYKDGVLYFHNADYFVQPIFNTSFINIGDMLDNGTVINGMRIDPPKNFQVACILTTQIIATVASNQYGKQYVDLSHLGKYIEKSYKKIEEQLKEIYKLDLNENSITEISNNILKKEIKAGVQTLLYQINTLMTTTGKPPKVALILKLNKDDEYLKENSIIIEEVLNQTYNGMKNEDDEFVVPHFPELIYVLDELNNLSGGEYDYLTKLAIKCTLKRSSPSYASGKKSKFLNEGQFNQGVVTINLVQIGLIADGDEEKFWEMLDEKLELCKEALMCRHYALLGINSNISPIHWQHGAISRINKNDKIDDLLMKKYSTLSLGYVGLDELSRVVKEKGIDEEEGHTFAIKVLKKLEAKTKEWQKDTGIGFNVYATESKHVLSKFAETDKEKFGTIKNVTDKGYYKKSYYMNEPDKIDTIERLKLEGEFQELTSGGAVSYVSIEKNKNNIENIVRNIYDNIGYVEFKL